MSEQSQIERQFGYRCLGDISQFKELQVIWNAIWKHQASARLPNGEKVYTKRYKGGTIWAVDFKGLKYIQQNPNTRSAYAQRAKQGAKIVWVIRSQPNEYLGYIEDGQVYMK